MAFGAHATVCGTGLIEVQLNTPVVLSCAKQTTLAQLIATLLPEASPTGRDASVLETELTALLERGRQQPDRVLTRPLDEAERSLPLWYEAVYGPWSDAIADLNGSMAELFLDLAYDILWVYTTWRDPLPVEDEAASVDLLHELDVDLKAFSDSMHMHPAFADRLRRRFEARALSRQYPVPLLAYLDDEVKRYASFQYDRARAMSLTSSLLALLVAWIHEIYHLAGR